MRGTRRTRRGRWVVAAVLAAAGLGTAPASAVDHDRLSLAEGSQGSAESRLVLYTTMATWCASCKGDLPQLQKLREKFSVQDLGIYAVPVDPADTREKLTAYVEQHKPAYRLLLDLSAEQRESVKALLQEKLRGEGLPASIVTDSTGKILLVEWGVPSISDVRRLLSSTTSR